MGAVGQLAVWFAVPYRPSRSFGWGPAHSEG
jgi:hypothetical protein